jgi:hypothetical protein
LYKNIQLHKALKAAVNEQRVLVNKQRVEVNGPNEYRPEDQAMK